jgi:hypothetical protein
VEGELDGAWGNVVNNSITELVEDSIAATATASVASGDWTLTTTGSGATNQARCAILVPTGSPGVTRNIIAPSSSKAYIVDNQSNASVVVKGSATTGVTISTGVRALVAWTGTDFVLVASSVGGGSSVSTISFGSTGLTPNSATSGAVTVAGTFAVGSGGTGQTSYTDGQLLIGNSTGNTLAKATLTAGSNITITNGPGSITIAAAGGGGVYMKGGTSTVGSLATEGQNIFRVNANTLNNSTTVASGENAQATGPLTIGTGITLTVSTGGRVSIV